MKKTILKNLINLSVAHFKKEAIHLTRFLEYKSLGSVKLSFKNETQRVSSISGSGNLCKIMGFSESEITNLEHPEYDIRSLPFHDSYFDVSIADQVLEHVDSEPGSVFREMSRVICPGGYFVNATVMTYPIHYGPKDMWRFTPEGHRYLFESSGFELVHEGSWGGKNAVMMVALDKATLAVPKWKRHPIRKIAENRGIDWPVVIWAIGRNTKKN